MAFRRQEYFAATLAYIALQDRRRRGRRVSAVLRRRDTERRGEFLITVQADVVDAHFAGLDTIHYLLKVWVFDL